METAAVFDVVRTLVMMDNKEPLSLSSSSSSNDDSFSYSGSFQPFFFLATCDCSSARIFLVALCAYLTVAIITNLIGLYKFIVAWNLLINQQRIDLPEFYKRRRRMAFKDALKLQLVPKFIWASHQSCTICLSDFTEHEIVTCCHDGCRNWFHKECLFEWLDRSENCPCCRRDMLSRKSRGFFADLSACMGFAPRTR